MEYVLVCPGWVECRRTVRESRSIGRLEHYRKPAKGAGADIEKLRPEEKLALACADPAWPADAAC